MMYAASMNFMNQSADARFAPACQSASNSASNLSVLGTVCVAVSIFVSILHRVLISGLRIILPQGQS